MEVIHGPVVVLDGADCAELARQLTRTIKLAYGAPGRPPPPRLLLDLADEISRAALSSASAEPRPEASPLVRAGVRNAELPAVADPSSSGQPVITATEAAETAGVSASYLRRALRRGDVQASRDRYGAWQVDADDLAAWLSERRRKERNRRAA